MSDPWCGRWVSVSQGRRLSLKDRSLIKGGGLPRVTRDRGTLTVKANRIHEKSPRVKRRETETEGRKVRSCINTEIGWLLKTCRYRRAISLSSFGFLFKCHLITWIIPKLSWINREPFAVTLNPVWPLWVTTTFHHVFTLLFISCLLPSPTPLLPLEMSDSGWHTIVT